MAMEYPEAIKAEPSIQVKRKILWYNIITWAIVIVSFMFFVVCFFVFKHKHLWNECELPIDENLFGAYGDFVGGVLGTVFAAYGTIMLIRTFQNQMKTNEMSQTTNERLLGATVKSNQLVQMQNFSEQFETFNDMYNEAINNYCSDIDKIYGRECLNKLCDEFLKQPFDKKSTYGKRIESAIKIYEDFYSFHREPMSVHLRMLYQLLYFISNTQDIDERTKVEYAKAIRGKLNDAELIFIRYNSRCPFGRKMQPFVNEFNLLKHLPLMRLFEFRKWSKLLDDKQSQTAINTTFLTLRKRLCDLILGTSSIGEDLYECGKKWHFVLLYRKADNTLLIKLQKIENATRRGTITPAIEKAFDKLDLENLEGLFSDYFRELFFYSNFCVYNNKDDVKLSHKGKRTKNNVSEVRFMFKSNYPLILSQRQIATPQAS